jgi:hypothetical protein
MCAVQQHLLCPKFEYIPTTANVVQVVTFQKNRRFDFDFLLARFSSFSLSLTLVTAAVFVSFDTKEAPIILFNLLVGAYIRIFNIELYMFGEKI